MQAAAEALQAVSTPLLGTVFSMVPASGSGAYAKYNAYYQTDQPLIRGERNGLQYPTAPPQPEYAIRRQPNDSVEQP